MLIVALPVTEQNGTIAPTQDEPFQFHDEMGLRQPVNCLAVVLRSLLLNDHVARCSLGFRSVAR